MRAELQKWLPETISPIHNYVLAGRGLVNGKPARASLAVKAGDILEIQFGTKPVKVEILDVQETVRKENASEMFRYL